MVSDAVSGEICPSSSIRAMMLPSMSGRGISLSLVLPLEKNMFSPEIKWELQSKHYCVRLRLLTGIRSYYQHLNMKKMKQYALTSLFAVSCACLYSCSAPEQVTQFAAKETISELTNLVAAHRDSDTATAVSSLHAFLADRTPIIIAAVKDMPVEEKIKLIQEIKQSAELKKLVETAMSISDGKLVKSYTELDDFEPEDIAGKLSFDTKIQLIEIVADIAKISVALGIENEKVRDSF